jgi:hypothetical protein
LCDAPAPRRFLHQRKVCARSGCEYGLRRMLPRVDTETFMTHNNVHYSSGGGRRRSLMPRPYDFGTVAHCQAPLTWIAKSRTHLWSAENRVSTGPLARYLGLDALQPGKIIDFTRSQLVGILGSKDERLVRALYDLSDASTGMTRAVAISPRSVTIASVSDPSRRRLLPWQGVPSRDRGVLECVHQGLLLLRNPQAHEGAQQKAQHLLSPNSRGLPGIR